MRLPIAALTIALLSPQLGALADPSPQPASLEDLNGLAIRLANGEPAPANVKLVSEVVPSAKLFARDSDYCGAACGDTCCCNYCSGWMCSLTCGVYASWGLCLPNIC